MLVCFSGTEGVTLQIDGLQCVLVGGESLRTVPLIAMVFSGRMHSISGKVAAAQI
jgi:hypothetical protein